MSLRKLGMLKGVVQIRNMIQGNYSLSNKNSDYCTFKCTMYKVLLTVNGPIG